MIQSSQKGKQQKDIKLKIFLKIVTTLIRFSIYITSYYYRQLEYQSSYFAIFASLGIFIAAQCVYWYRQYKKDNIKDCSKVQTAILHVGCLMNLLAMGFTCRYSDINPSSHFFLFEIGLLFNYFLTISYLYAVYFNPAVKNIQEFLLIHQPFDNSIWYLFVGLYIGAFFDTLAFSRESSIVFIWFNIIMSAQLLVKFVKSKGTGYFWQAFTSQ